MEAQAEAAINEIIGLQEIAATEQVIRPHIRRTPDIANR